MENSLLAASTLNTQLAKMVKGLTPEQSDLIAAGKAVIVLVPKGSKVVEPLDLPALADQLRRMDSADEIVRLLGSDKRLTAAVLLNLAYELNLEVPSASKSAPARTLYIAQTLIEHRRRTTGGL